MSRRRPRRVKSEEIWPLYLFFLALLLISQPNPQLEPFWPLVLYVSVFAGIFLGIDALINWKRRNKMLSGVKSVLEGGMSLESESSDRPPYCLIDSTDRMILDCLSQTNSDIIAVQDILSEESIESSAEDIGNRLLKLRVLGLIRLDKDDDLVLTSRGLDARNMPPVLFSSNVPTNIWLQMVQLRKSLLQQEWTGMGVALSRILELILRDRIGPAIHLDSDRWETLKSKYKSGQLDQLTAGQLQEVALAMGVLRQSSFENWLVTELIGMRKQEIHPKEEAVAKSSTRKDAALVNLYLEILIQILY